MMEKVTISIKGLQASGGDESEEFELVTEGEYMSEDGYSTFTYLESELTGYNGLVTTFSVEPDRVILSRGGGVNGDMIFSETQKHHFLYETPFGAITMGIDTRSIRKDLCGDGGSLEVRYSIEVDNVVVSRNIFEIDIKRQTGGMKA